MQLTVAAVQMTSTDNVSENIARAEQLIRQAVRRGASVVALPENFAYLRSEAEAVEYRQAIDGEMIGSFKKLAAELMVYLLAGSFPEQTANNKIHNTSLLISPRGEVIA